MIPVKIKMINFLSYEETEFDFSKITNATVVGENGAGKSSFCTDSIVWAIYGIASKGGANEQDNYVHEGAESCTVEFTFDLNKNLYKIIRTHSIAKNKNSLTLFTINSDGDEIPVSNNKITETQAYIESLIKMNYKTFISSSMMFQNKSNEFTENMSDTDRKEALISILDIDEWDKFSKLATSDISRIKSEVEIEENNISNYNSIIEKEEDYRNKKEISDKDLNSVNKEKEKQTKILNDNQQKIYQMETIENTIKSKEKDAFDLKNKIDYNNNKISKLQSEIVDDNNKLKIYNENINNAQKLIDNKDKINTAVNKENELMNEINNQENNRLLIYKKNEELNSVAQKGKDWNAQQKQQISILKTNIAHAQEQASALISVPCSSNANYNTTCPFLVMANKAKNSLVDLNNQLNNIVNSVNPYRFEWKKVHDEYTALSATFSEEKLNILKQDLINVRKYSSFKPQLDAAVNQINEIMNFIEMTKKYIDDKKNNILELQNENNKYANDIKLINDELTKAKIDANNFNGIRNVVNLAKDELSRLTNQENELKESIIKYATLIEQVENTKVKINNVKNKILSKKEELRVATIFQEACGKKSGVPSFIVENAVPELMDIANKVLDKMLDGRLQLKFETQIETKTTKNLKEVLKIIVYDNGYARKYETYSGAEKFVIDLAIRIAMSKFLAHRAGTSIQLFVLDEGVSCADANNRQEIIESIRNISNEFEKVLFITHLDELKDSLDQKILVTKDSKGSHIKVIN